MNRYNFVRAAKPEVTAASLEAAKAVTDVTDILNASALIGEYKFEKSEDLSKVFAEAEAVRTEIATRGNGSECNRVRILLPNGKSFLCRAYGTKGAAILPPHRWEAAEIPNIVAGFCTSDGERVTELRQSPSGELLAVPVIYVLLG